MLIIDYFINAHERLFCVPKSMCINYLEVFCMLENIIFGLMVVAALSAAVFTCVYEMGGFKHSSDKEQPISQTDNKKSN